MGVIYLILNEGTGQVKFGHTDGDPEERRAKLQVGCPGTLRIIGTLPGDEEMEGDLHRQFAHLRLDGEWFKLCAEILELFRAGESRRAGAYAVDEQLRR